MLSADSVMRRADSLSLRSRRNGVTGLLCACTHYLVFKEPTVCAPVAPSPRSRLTGCLADRVQGNLLRLLAPTNLVNPLFGAPEKILSLAAQLLCSGC